MDMQSPDIEWVIAQSEAEWERLRDLSLPENERVAGQSRLWQRYCWRGAALFLLLASGGGWHRTEQAVLPPPAAGVNAVMLPPGAVAVDNDQGAADLTDDQWQVAWRRQFEQTHGWRDAASPPYEPQPYMDVTLQTVEFKGDQAVARVIVHANNNGLAYRQTWFYRRTVAGWSRSERDAALWGPARSLQTPYFAYHFRQNDAPVVTAVAPQMDALYTTLWRNFGLPIQLTPEKLVVEVSVTQPPGWTTPWYRGSNRVVASSPAAYLAPAELSDAEILAQSLALPLLEQVLAQARTRHDIAWSWQPLLDGLHLWQLWDLDLPLSAWREDVVQWLYRDLPATATEQPGVLPARYRKLCAAHKLWMASPVQLHIPLVCVDGRWEDWYLSPWRASAPLTRLDQFSLPAPKSSIRPNVDPPSPGHPGQTVALATLVEYATAIYGRERLPALVAGLGQYDTWETLLPAVYGVSASEFETGWQAYLAAQYGVSLSSIGRAPGTDPATAAVR